MAMTRLLRVKARVLTLMAIVGAMAVVHGHGISFLTLDPAYVQHVFARTTLSSGRYLGGVAVLQSGDVIAAECQTNGTKLHRFSASATYVKEGTTLHQETTMSTAGGCGIALHPNGYLYSNMRDSSGSGFGVARIDLATGASSRMGPAGNALGIAVDPVTNHLVYAGSGCKPAFGPPPCILFDLDPATGTATNFAVLNVSQTGYVDGIAFEPTGTFLFLTNRYPAFELVVLNRSGAVVRRAAIPSEPVGIGFHATSPKFVVTNNQDGTITRFDFPNDDYTAAPTATQFASGGFRGDLMQAGPDSCLYVTQNGTRYDNGTQDNEANSIVQICSGFATPPGITPNPPPPPSSLCGFVYNDFDNDGINDAAEAGIPGTSVRLTGTDTLGRSVSATTTTASDGSYCFKTLDAGTYTISETQPPGYLDGKDTQGTPGTGSTGNDVFTDIVLAAGVDGKNNNFGELLASSLCGFVYVDSDNNGIKAAGESGIPGTKVTLAGSDDRGSINIPMSTGADGGYCFMNLRPGTYTITETQPAGYLDGKDTQGTPGTGTTGNDVFSNIALSQNVNGQNNNFGEIAVPAIALVKKTNGTDNDSVPGVLVRPGSTITWTYIISNTGTAALSSVVLTDDKIGTIGCPATTLAIGAGMTCTATGMAVAGQYTNVGSVTAVDSTGKTASAQNVDHYLGVVPPAADLGLAVSAPATVVAGTTLNYTVNAFNNGASPATDVTVIHSVPSNMKFLSLGKPAGWSCITPAPGGAGTIQCTKSSMAFRETASFSIAVGSSCPVPNAGAMTLAAAIDSPTPDPNLLNNASAVTTTIINPAPVISNAQVNPSTIWPPNHKMQNVRVAYTVTGGCGGIVSTRLNVTSNEPTNGTNWQILDAHNLRLRSERNGGGSGRIYTISIIATDPATGISTTKTVRVTVVHDQGNGKR
jgi:uncharacterized repeat protein (TIGR01451 family)